MTADVFYLNYYPDVYDKFNSKLNPKVTRALKSLHQKSKEENNLIISAWLCLYFSSVEVTTLDEMLETLNNISIVQDEMKKTSYYDEDSWKIFLSVNNELNVIFNWLKAINFHEYWTSEIIPLINQRINEIEPGLVQYDVIKMNEYYLGFKLPSNEITVYMLYYCRPHGIKITGTRFLTNIEWPFESVIRIAAHEMMHPPYNCKNDIELKNAILSFQNDKFLMEKVLNHNPSYGYNTLDGLIEEDCVQSLDQLINEQFGIAVDAHKRWKESDDGIHVFAIALFQVLKVENYNINKELFRDFLVRIITGGKLSAGKIKEYYDKFYKLI